MPKTKKIPEKPRGRIPTESQGNRKAPRAGGKGPHRFDRPGHFTKPTKPKGFGTTRSSTLRSMSARPRAAGAARTTARTLANRGRKGIGTTRSSGFSRLGHRTLGTSLRRTSARTSVALRRGAASRARTSGPKIRKPSVARKLSR